MNVPPFVPQPVEIPGNVAQETYSARLSFLKRVAIAYGLSAIAIALTSLVSLDLWPYDLVLVGASLLLLSLTRALAKGRFIEQRLSLLVAPALFLALGVLIHHLRTLDWPIWVLGLGIIWAIGYTLSCGRDLSFLGMWFISILGSSISAIVLGYLLHVKAGLLLEAIALNIAFLSYWVYDFAALLTRRRLGEEVGAVLDLYRDVLNMFSYPVRVLHHWRTHRIWSRP